MPGSELQLQTKEKMLPDPALMESQINENYNYVKCKGKRYCAVRAYDRRFRPIGKASMRKL